jgi:aldose 1-epimerase
MDFEQSPRDRPPSGDQFAIAYADAQVQVSQVGATLRHFTVGGRNVIDGFAVDERATDGRGQVLAPWPNRLTGGRYRYGDRDCQAPINEVGRHTAIHGLVRWLDWSLVTQDPRSVTLSCAVRPQPGYEWQLDLQITYALSQAGLVVTCQAVNADREPAPFGVGFHPYLTLGTASVDGLTLTVPATTYLQPDSRAGGPFMVPVTATPQDFTRPRRIESTQLDAAFGSLVRGSDGRAVARLQDPDSGRSLHLWVDDSYRYLMAYTADQVSRPERRRARRGHRTNDLPAGRIPNWRRPHRAGTRGVLAGDMGAGKRSVLNHVRGSYRLGALPAHQAQPVSHGRLQPRDHRSTLEALSGTARRPRRRWPETAPCAEEDSSAEENDRHLGRGYGEGHRVQRRKTDAGGEQDDRHSPAALTQEPHHPVRPGSQLCPNATGWLARALAYLPHQT